MTWDELNSWIKKNIYSLTINRSRVFECLKKKMNFESSKLSITYDLLYVLLFPFTHSSDGTSCRQFGIQQTDSWRDERIPIVYSKSTWCTASHTTRFRLSMRTSYRWTFLLAVHSIQEFTLRWTAHLSGKWCGEIYRSQSWPRLDSHRSNCHWVQKFNTSIYRWIFE